jgi:anaerobic selenocysteine-containing dehydrogenase
MSRKPTTEEVFELLTRGSRIPLEEVKKHPRGALFPESILAAPKDPQCTARLDVGNAEMMAELSAVHAKPAVEAGEFPYLLIGRHMAHVYNSSGRDLPMLVAKGGAHNPAFMHPLDLAALGVRPGDPVTIRSAHGSICAFVALDESLRRGLVSISHAFGGLPDEDEDPRQVGSNTSLLTSVEDDYDRYSGIPRMSAVPVRVDPAAVTSESFTSD